VALGRQVSKTEHCSHAGLKTAAGSLGISNLKFAISNPSRSAWTSATAFSVSHGARRTREGWAEALRTVPPAELERDFAVLQALRETPDEWDATEWRWPEPDAHEEV